MILSDALILPVSQLQTHLHSKWPRHKLGHIEYLLPTYYIVVLIS